MEEAVKRQFPDQAAVQIKEVRDCADGSGYTGLAGDKKAQQPLIEFNRFFYIDNVPFMDPTETVNALSPLDPIPARQPVRKKLNDYLASAQRCLSDEEFRRFSPPFLELKHQRGL